MNSLRKLGANLSEKLDTRLAAYLAAAGIGTLRVIDPDVVSLSNLQRQILFGADDIGKPKAEAARDAAHRINPDCHVIPINTALTPDNAATLLREADIILDGCDNFHHTIRTRRVTYGDSILAVLQNASG